MRQGVVHSANAARPRPYLGWKKLIVGGLAALLPKCFGCVAGWLAVTAGIRTIVPEICGDAPGPTGSWTVYFWVWAAIFTMWVIPMAWKRVRRISLRPARVTWSAAVHRIR
jgi:hypothetical protein